MYSVLAISTLPRIAIGCWVIFGPINAVIGQWFKQKRGLVMGFVATRSSIGGTLFPIVARNLIPRVGLGIANLAVKWRLPPKQTGSLLNPVAFKNFASTIYVLAAITSLFGRYTAVLTYIDISATSVCLSLDFSFYLISLCNAASLFALNVITPMNAIAELMTYVWPLAQSKGSFVAISLVYG
ncbi:hypothetical protein C8F04DRAFT_1264357 [Mycena alexandri]|uniref:Uncharacterized protein n=1 Tax=Mycena alexandri TaxID=1745969 RepID=A0AAD6WYI8_9AGAR|nr:hypothetical protein C8F04DRAFT_1264357 [Mycena alexandri]